MESSSNSLFSDSQASGTDSPGKISKVVVDPDGDVILVFDAGTEVQVSSKVLSVASPVFKAMFGPRFLEGQDLNTTTPKRVSLPEDNAAAMTTLCNVVHHRHNSVRKVLALEQVVELATICDKYNCSEAFSLWSYNWGCHLYWSEGFSSHKDAARLLNSFFVFNDDTHVKKISHSIVFRTKGFVDEPNLADLLPEGVFGEP